MIFRKCRLFREAWSEQFDRLAGMPGVDVSHLAECSECRSFTTAAMAARAGLQGAPNPEPDAGADLAVLAALRSSPASASAPGISRAGGNPFDWLRPWVGARTMVAGIASFVVTLGVAQFLSTVAVPAAAPNLLEQGVSQPPEGRARGYLVNRIELWTGSAPDTTLAPPTPKPVVPSPGTDRKSPVDEGETGDRAGTRPSIQPLG